jgi:hypothetical protein
MTGSDWSVSYRYGLLDGPHRQRSGAGWATCVQTRKRDPEGSLCERQTYPG